MFAWRWCTQKWNKGWGAWIGKRRGGKENNVLQLNAQAKCIYVRSIRRGKTLANFTLCVYLRPTKKRRVFQNPHCVYYSSRCCRRKENVEFVADTSLSNCWSKWSALGISRHSGKHKRCIYWIFRLASTDTHAHTKIYSSSSSPLFVINHMMPVYKITEEWVKKDSHYENNCNVGHCDYIMAHSSRRISSGL